MKPESFGMAILLAAMAVIAAATGGLAAIFMVVIAFLAGVIYGTQGGT